MRKWDIVKLFLSPVQWIYLVFLAFHWLDWDFKKDIRKSLGNWWSFEKLRWRINYQIRINLIIVVFWANAGAVLALMLGLVGLYFAIVDIKQDWFELKGLAGLFQFSLIGFVIIVLTTPILISKVIEHLPSKQLAEMSLSGLRQDDMIIAVAMEMWNLCHNFHKKVNKRFEVLLKEFHFQEDDVGNEYSVKGDLREVTKLILLTQKTLMKYMRHDFKKIYLCRELKKQATSQLKIHEREFCHHILKFSTEIFKERVEVFIRRLDSLLYHINADANNGSRVVISEDLEELTRILDDIKHERMKSLLQIIVHPQLHEVLVGISSITSTSESLKIFSRGLSTCAEKMRSKFNIETVGAFKALLHRSKAHRGIDLLIPLENFYLCHQSLNICSTSDGEITVPELLKTIKSKKLEDMVDNKILGTRENHMVEINCIIKIRENINLAYQNAIKDIKMNFVKRFKNLECNKDSQVYFLVFGYSKMVRNVLWHARNIINELGIQIFVMKQENNEMLDTRMLRFELQNKKNSSIRNTFTASDDFFLRLLKRKDKVILLAGAEAYDKRNKQLIHTNNYQTRIERIIKRLNRKKREVWIVGGDYKIYKKGFQFNNSTKFEFRNEFYCDHYDNVDLYNFSDLKIKPKLITN